MTNPDQYPAADRDSYPTQVRDERHSGGPAAHTGHDSLAAPAPRSGDQDHSSHAGPVGSTDQDHGGYARPVGSTDQDHGGYARPVGSTDQDHGSHTGPVRTNGPVGATDTGSSARPVEGQDGANKLFPAARAGEYSSRWNAVKGEFVDEPRRAVDLADKLVGELLEELQELFSRQRRSLDHGLDHDQTSTEDLRVALGRYRDFFDRLLSL